jgi:hypothetical protein
VYASIRTYRVGAGSVDDVMHRIDREFAESLSREPGFVAYQAIALADWKIATMTVFRHEDQAEASNDLAAQWVAQELADFDIERMGVMGGPVQVSRSSIDMLEAAHS